MLAPLPAAGRVYDGVLTYDFGIDPGLQKTGWGIVDVNGNRLTHISHGVIATDGKARFCRLDPRTGARLVVLEAARNVACTGAVPRALVNCLNFGNPEHPEVMWQFAEVVEGISEACEALGIPVVGGNVSFYNESRGEAVYPTPVIDFAMDAAKAILPTAA